jgi:flagellar export protein FliJ
VFKFPLQRVLELREKAEQEKASGLAAARAQAESAQRAYALLSEVRRAGSEQLATAHGARSIGELQHLSYVLDRLDDRLAAAGEACRAAEQGAAASLGEFTLAVQERRVIEKLRLRRHEVWSAAEAQAERAAMDGVALSQFVQRGAARAAGE